MSIYKPKNSPHWHYDFQHKGRRFYGSTGCTARRAAEAYEARIRHEQLTATTAKRPPITLDQAAGLYAASIDSKPSWPNARRTLAILVAAIGANRLLSEITQPELSRLVARRRSIGGGRVRANSSVNREIEDWRALWRQADRARFDVGIMPDWRQLMLPVKAKAPRELSPAEEARLFQALRADLQPMVLFALRSGWRMSEVLSLRWADVDFEAGVARVRIKGGDTVVAPLSAQMRAILGSQPKVCAQVFTYVAATSRTTHADKTGRHRIARRRGERYPYSKSGWRKAWTSALSAAGIDDFRFHDLRHTTATRILRATGNLAATGKALHHSSLKTTMRYAHVLDEDVRNALDAADSRNSPERPSSRSRNSKSA